MAQHHSISLCARASDRGLLLSLIVGVARTSSTYGLDRSISARAGGPSDEVLCEGHGSALGAHRWIWNLQTIRSLQNSYQNDVESISKAVQSGDIAYAKKLEAEQDVRSV